MKLFQVFWLALLACVSYSVRAANCDVYQFSDFAGCIRSDTTANLKADLVLSTGQTIIIAGVSNFTLNGNDNGVNRSIDESASRFSSNTSDSDHYVEIANSNGVNIRNIAFRSTPATDAYCANPGIYVNKAPCYGMVLAANATNIEITNSQFLARKTFQLQLYDTTGVLVARNSFSNAATYGIWMASGAGSLRTIQITDNTFTGAGANAVVIADVDGAWIGNNTFINNHRLTQFNGYGGGQLLFEESDKFPTTNVDVTGNTITATSVTTSHGIEFANFDKGKRLENVNVIWNRIQGNGQGAIKFDGSNVASGVKSVNISNNEFINNASPYLSQFIRSAFDDVKIGNNWTESLSAVTKSSFDGTATTCTLLPGESRCNIDIKWNVNLPRGGSLVVTVREVGSQVGSKSRGWFAAGITGSGQQSAPWIGTNGAIFELFFESDYAQEHGWEAPIASILVKAVPAGN